MRTILLLAVFCIGFGSCAEIPERDLDIIDIYDTPAFRSELTIIDCGVSLTAETWPSYFLRTNGKLIPINRTELSLESITDIQVIKPSLAENHFGQRGKNGVVLVSVKD